MTLFWVVTLGFPEVNQVSLLPALTVAVPPVQTLGLSARPAWLTVKVVEVGVATMVSVPLHSREDDEFVCAAVTAIVAPTAKLWAADVVNVSTPLARAALESVADVTPSADAPTVDEPVGLAGVSPPLKSSPTTW